VGLVEQPLIGIDPATSQLLQQDRVVAHVRHRHQQLTRV
jgi:hypothetical protein